MVVTAWWCAMTGIVPWFLCLSMRRRPCQARSFDPFLGGRFGTCAVVSWTFCCSRDSQEIRASIRNPLF